MFLISSIVLELCFIYLRLHGHKIMSHQEAAIFTARRLEMCEIVELTLLYLRDRPRVHSDVSDLPFLVSFCLMSGKREHLIVTFIRVNYD